MGASSLIYHKIKLLTRLKIYANIKKIVHSQKNNDSFKRKDERMKNTSLLKGLTKAMIIVSILVFTLADRKGPTVIKHKAVFFPPKKTEIIIVEEGESLSYIAYQRENIPYWQYLALLNNMEKDPSYLIAGQTLIVPAE